MTTIRRSSSSIVTASCGSDSLLGEPNLAAMPEEVLLLLLQYVDDDKRAHQNILALERTCRAFRNLLRDDKVWSLIASQDGSEEDEYQYPPTVRERVFIRMSIENIWSYQEGTENLLMKFLGGYDGVRRLAYKLLNEMTSNIMTNYIFEFCKDAIEYIAEIIQCNVIFKLQKVWMLALGRLKPGDSYPTVSARDYYLLDGLFQTDDSGAILACCIADRRHRCMLTPSHITWCRNIRGSPIKYIGEEKKSKLVRALAYRAGIVKMSGEVFSIVSTEILHDMAVLVFRAFDISIDFLQDSWQPVIITPHKIKYAAEFLGMRPILLGSGFNGDGWDEEGHDAMEDGDEEYVQDDSESECSDTFEYDDESDSELDDSDSQ